MLSAGEVALGPLRTDYALRDLIHRGVFTLQPRYEDGVAELLSAMTPEVHTGIPLAEIPRSFLEQFLGERFTADAMSSGFPIVARRKDGGFALRGQAVLVEPLQLGDYFERTLISPHAEPSLLVVESGGLFIERGNRSTPAGPGSSYLLCAGFKGILNPVMPNPMVNLMRLLPVV